MEVTAKLICARFTEVIRKQTDFFFLNAYQSNWLKTQVSSVFKVVLKESNAK